LSNLANSPAGKITVGMAALYKASPNYAKEIAAVNSLKEKMPIVIFTIDSSKEEGAAFKGGINQKQQAAFDILWTDLVTVLTSLLKVDANSNPNVRVVREKTSRRMAGWKAAQEAYAGDAVGKGQTEVVVSYGNPNKPGISTEGVQVALTAENAVEEGRKFAKKLAVDGMLTGRNRLNLFAGRDDLLPMARGLRVETYNSALAKRFGWIIQTAIFPIWSHKGLEANLAHSENPAKLLLADKTINFFLNARTLGSSNQFLNQPFNDMGIMDGRYSGINGATIHQTNDAMTIPNIRRMAEVSPTILFEFNDNNPNVEFAVRAFYKGLIAEFESLEKAAAAPAEKMRWEWALMYPNYLSLPGHGLFSYRGADGKNFTLRAAVPPGTFTINRKMIVAFREEEDGSLRQAAMPPVCGEVLRFIEQAFMKDNIMPDLSLFSKEPTPGYYVHRLRYEKLGGMREAFIDDNHPGQIRIVLQVLDKETGSLNATLYVFKRAAKGAVEKTKGEPIKITIGLESDKLKAALTPLAMPEEIEAYNDTAKRGLVETLAEIRALKETTVIPKDMAVVIAIDTGVDDGTLGVAQMSGKVLKAFLGDNDSVAVVRARGDKLADAVEAEVARLQNLSGGGKRVAVVVNAGAEISPAAEERLRSIVEKAGPAIAPQGRSALLKIVSVPNTPISLIGLLDVDLKIAYGRNDDDILSQLARVAVNDTNNQPFTKSDLENILSGRLGLRPIMPFNINRIYEMRESEKKALHSL
ncbi:MAG: hypothetical protein Q7S07_06055, partial [Candidatus Omnitrophota bacterium]|nr:hypothetical protein [Candidatus Omnitrophota bacterium]